MSKTDEYEKYKKTITLDSQTMFLIDETIFSIENEWNYSFPDGFEITDDVLEYIVTTCYNIEINWEDGICYETISDIIYNVTNHFNIKRE